MVRISKNADLQILFYNTWLIAQLILQYQYANYTNPDYKVTGEASLKLQLINQRSDFSFALFTGGFSTVNSFSFFHLCFLIIFKAALYGPFCIHNILTICGQPTMVAVSNIVTFENPNAPIYPRLAQGKMWDEVSSLYVILDSLYLSSQTHHTLVCVTLGSQYNSELCFT